MVSATLYMPKVSKNAPNVSPLEQVNVQLAIGGYGLGRNRQTQTVQWQVESKQPSGTSRLVRGARFAAYPQLGIRITANRPQSRQEIRGTIDIGLPIFVQNSNHFGIETGTNHQQKMLPVRASKVKTDGYTIFDRPQYGVRPGRLAHEAAQ
jgi:hypothetical protein